MEESRRPHRWQTLLAFAIIYLVWGSTFLAIRVGVREVPPFLLAGMRFFAAGISYLSVDACGWRAFSDSREWISASFSCAVDLRGRLRLAFLGGKARAFWDRCSHDGYYSGLHGASGNYHPAHAKAYTPLGICIVGNWRRSGAG